MSEWKVWDGSPDQIAEIKNTNNGYVVRRKSGEEVCFLSIEYKCRYEDVVSYWIIPDDPLREMKIRQAVTGQPVLAKVPWSTPISFEFIKAVSNNTGYSIFVTNTPDWNIPNAEYSFTEFKEEV